VAILTDERKLTQIFPKQKFAWKAATNEETEPFLDSLLYSSNFLRKFAEFPHCYIDCITDKALFEISPSACWCNI
jgi:hypothetical protein